MRISSLGKRLVGLVLVLAGALTATALASLPDASSNRIVPGKSIGGVELGQAFSAAKGAWGKGRTCEKFETVRSCEYAGNGDGCSTNSTLPKATFTAKATGPVNFVGISAGYGCSGYDFDTPLKDFKTKKGIGIGSTKRDVKDAYPDGENKARGYVYVLTGPRKHKTWFQLGGPSDEPPRVVHIHVSKK